jgi:hypothetical protein
MKVPYCKSAEGLQKESLQAEEKKTKELLWLET